MDKRYSNLGVARLLFSYEKVAYSQHAWYKMFILSNPTIADNRTMKESTL
jgi:hypothetical protein